MKKHSTPSVAAVSVSVGVSLGPYLGTSLPKAPSALSPNLRFGHMLRTHALGTCVPFASTSPTYQVAGRRFQHEVDVLAVLKRRVQLDDVWVRVQRAVDADLALYLLPACARAGGGEG